MAKLGLRSIILACAAWLGFANPAMAQRSTDNRQEAEASAAFDSEDVAPVLLRISQLLDSGLGAAEACALAGRITSQALDSEHAYEYQVTYKGTRVGLRIVAFMDDVEAPDIAFFTSPALAAAIDKRIFAYFKDVGK